MDTQIAILRNIQILIEAGGKAGAAAHALRNRKAALRAAHFVSGVAEPFIGLGDPTPELL